MTIVYFLQENFFDWSHSLTPEQLLFFISQYITSFGAIVETNKGEPGQIMGELANASYVTQDSEILSCKTALECMTYLTNVLNPDLVNQEFPAMDIRMGISSGHGIIGYVGNESIEYTVFGAFANVAKKLAELNAYYGTRVLLDQKIYDVSKKDFAIRPVDRVRIKQYIFCIYELLGAYHDNQTANKLGHFVIIAGKAWKAYENKDWHKAKALYQDLLEIDPTDTLSTMFVDRCEKFIENPPDNTWDGTLKEL